MEKKDKKEVDTTALTKREKKTGYSLSGLAQTESGKLTKSNYFRFLDHNLDEYDKIELSPDEAKKLHTHLQKLSTGSTAMVPMFCAGNQCQPAGSMVMTTEGEVSIEDITENHRLWAYDRKAASIRNSGYQAKLYSRDFNGMVFSISTDEENYICTGEHKVLARWSEKAKEAFCVYLMEKNGFFRIGKTKLFKNSNGRYRFGPGERMRAEKADAIWLLGIYKTNSKALLAEEYFSVEWQIPKALFLATDKSERKWDGLYRWVSQEKLDLHHKLLQKPREHYAKLLFKQGLSIEYPFKVAKHAKCPLCNTERDNKYGGMVSVFEIPAFNFISGYMEVPVVPEKLEYIGRRRPALWKEADRGISFYNGKVYSLDVEKHHTYVTNGIITHNCPFADRCPLQQMDKAPVGKQCLLEKRLLTEFIVRYFEEFDVDPNNWTEVGYINELAEIMIMEMRLNMSLARKENSELIIDQVASIGQDGTPIIQKQLSPYMEQKDRLASRRSRIIKLMVGDRQEKYKKEAALKVKLDADPSSRMASMRGKLETLQRQLDTLSHEIPKGDSQEGIVTPEDIIDAVDDDGEGQ